MMTINNLKLNNEKISGCTVLEFTDGYSKQYRSGAVLYLLSYVSFKYNIKIDRMIGAPDHGKDVVHGINACDKRYLKGKMCIIGTPEADDCSKKMMTHSMIGNEHYRFAEDCNMLCECSDREDRSKDYRKYKMREGKSNLKKDVIMYKIRMM